MKNETNPNNVTLGSLLSEAFPELESDTEQMEMIYNLKEENSELRRKNNKLLDEKHKMHAKLGAMVQTMPDVLDWRALADFGFKIDAIKKLRNDSNGVLCLIDSKAVVEDYIRRMGL